MISAGAQRLLGFFTAAVCLFSVAPVVIVVLESFTTTDYVVFPPPGLGIKWYAEFIKRPEFVDSVYASLIVAVGASILSTALGTMAALVLVRRTTFGARLLTSLFAAPLSLPGIILGLALLQFLVRYGVPRNTLTMIAAHIVITMPFAVRFVSVALLGVDQNAERAAQSLGANPLRTFWHVTLPLIRPGIVASFVFTFILSFDEVAASLFMATPDLTTLPVRIFVYIDQNYDPLVTSVSSLLVFAAAIALAIIERTIGVGRLFGMR